VNHGAWGVSTIGNGAIPIGERVSPFATTVSGTTGTVILFPGAKKEVGSEEKTIATITVEAGRANARENFTV